VVDGGNTPLTTVVLHEIMSLQNAVSTDARAVPGTIAAGMSGVKDITYQESTLDRMNLHGARRRNGEAVIVVMEGDADAIDVTLVIEQVEDGSDWVLNTTEKVSGDAFLVFTREWW